MLPFWNPNYTKNTIEKSNIFAFVLNVLIKVHEPTVDTEWGSSKIAITNKYSSF